MVYSIIRTRLATFFRCCKGCTNIYMVRTHKDMSRRIVQLCTANHIEPYTTMYNLYSYVKPCTPYKTFTTMYNLVQHGAMMYKLVQWYTPLYNDEKTFTTMYNSVNYVMYILFDNNLQLCTIMYNHVQCATIYNLL